MTRHRRNIALAAVVLILVVLNLVHWFYRPSLGARHTAANRVHDIRAADFNVTAAPANGETRPLTRDPFQPKITLVARPTVKKVEPPPGPPAPPPKTPEELEQDAARAELATIKLVGVVFKGDRPQAFLVKGDQVFLAVIGDKVAGRFTVDKITADSVSLSDPKTAISGSVSISGG